MIMRYYALLKSKGQGTWKAVYPFPAGTTRLKASALMRRAIKKGKTYKIVSKMQLDSIVGRTQGTPKRRTRSRKVKARGVVRRTRARRSRR
jgi:hypothetical protein